jgi:hypothetical protein
MRVGIFVRHSGKIGISETNQLKRGASGRYNTNVIHFFKHISMQRKSLARYITVYIYLLLEIKVTRQ